MTRRAAWPRHPASESGFILPGVVMFVIVLTILGFSLFALSSYEAQFMSRSLDQADAFYTASGAIDRARFLLAAQPYPATLGRVTPANLGPGVEYARALQNGDSSGNVLPDAPVTITVMAEKDSVRRKLEAQFIPTPQPYDNLFSMSSTTRGLYVSPEGGSYYARNQAQLVGTVWQIDSDYAVDIFDRGGLALGSNLDLEIGAVPVPQVTTFWSTFQSVATPLSPGPAQAVIDLLPGANNTGFFRTTKPPGGSWSLDHTGQDLTINVDGIAIWMFDFGFRSRTTVHVNGDAGDMLVLVAKKGSDPTAYGNNPGIVFERGLMSPAVPVIMVSDGLVATANEDENALSSVSWLSVYADFGYVVGPMPSAGLLTYSHVVGGSPQAEANLQRLLDNGYLPNASASRRKLAYIPGTWQELPTP